MNAFSNKNEEAVLFSETQKFRQKWIWSILISVCGFLIALFIYGIVKQCIMGIPFGNRPLSNSALIFTGGFFISLSILLLILFSRMKLTTRIQEEKLLIKFNPFHGKFMEIPLEDIQKCKLKEFNPILDYGGWGIRKNRDGKAYIISGNRGIMLEFSNNERLLVGSQKSRKLLEIIDRIKKEQPADS